MKTDKTLEQLEVRLSKLNDEYTAAGNDSRFRNAAFGAAGHLSKGSRNYLRNHRLTEKNSHL